MSAYLKLPIWCDGKGHTKESDDDHVNVEAIIDGSGNIDYNSRLPKGWICVVSQTTNERFHYCSKCNKEFHNL